MLLKKFNEAKQVPINGIPNKEEIVKKIIEDSRKPEFQLKNDSNNIKIGIAYAPTVLTILHQEDNPEFIKIDSKIRNILLQEQIDTVSNIKQVYDNTNCNIGILAKAHNLSIEAMVDMIVENHINELKFMICQLDDNICNILNQYFSDSDLNIDSMINPHFIYIYRDNAISNIMKIADLPEDTRAVSYEEGLQLYLMANMNYIAQNIWNNIEKSILYIINDSANYKINPNNIFRDAGFEFSAFMMGCYTSLGKLFYNLANPIGVGTFNGAPPVEDNESNDSNGSIPTISFF